MKIFTTNYDIENLYFFLYNILEEFKIKFWRTKTIKLLTSIINNSRGSKEISIISLEMRILTILVIARQTIIS